MSLTLNTVPILQVPRTAILLSWPQSPQAVSSVCLPVIMSLSATCDHVCRIIGEGIVQNPQAQLYAGVTVIQCNNGTVYNGTMAPCFYNFCLVGNYSTVGITNGPTDASGNLVANSFIYNVVFNQWTTGLFLRDAIYSTVFGCSPTFYSLAEVNAAIGDLLTRLNEARPIHRLGVTRRQLLEEIDRPALSSDRHR